MFNAPRRMGGNLTSSAFLSSPASSPTFDPLASTVPNPSSSYGEVDPWSSSPNFARSGNVRRESEEVIPPAVGNGAESALGRGGLSALLDDPPPLYLSLLDSLDPPPGGAIPLSSVHRLLAASRLPASTVERIITLTARDASSLSRTEFFCTLALVALAQSSSSDTEISLDALSAALPNLPLPSITTVASPRAYTALPETPSLSPWDTAPRANGHSSGPEHAAGNSNLTDVFSGGQSGAFDVEAERGYWKKLETVEVSLAPHKEGWFLQKYIVESDKRTGGAVSRRYSDFVWLLDCLTKRYPFRLLPSLPPKRIGPDASFLEQRRKALKRFLNMVVNHPVTRDDGALNVFLTEHAFETWRKRTKVSTDEESVSKRLNSAHEMGIPADLDEKLAVLRDHLPALLTSYQKLVVLAERSLGRLQAANADASRIALSLGTISEEMPRCCFRGAEADRGCSLCTGVGRGMSEVGESWTRLAEEGEKRAIAILHGSIEALKSQRDLYVAFRDLFVRHDKLSRDSVDALRKKVEGRQKKIESAKNGQKPGWELEVDKQIAANDQDNSSIASLLARRVFIRACMWHELALVFHSRQAAQATIAWRQFAREELEASRGVSKVWEELGERLQSMPIE
ncbi:hypothetical protein DB88DRAFT_495217 [Papiliotrema laurentii]|uniref:Sorting nexin MVP1 n=1 Tax=Papiliotrema laurentii TaxID=5418 RepID=A0AAD9CXX3_PAPLA|nr:hypothetical protein DB88DRAFT_495217 [Papiliotrema laurentii]